ncbi:hypothetical protein [Caballeronia mineralivorans]|uniref:hypothetical protein n=1 Tax=Caballeronia mineralivorans TaxID=2010198 RepID=UPI0023F15030|nr:hypothetical protein [Caballeronia mineralivorans]MDB5784167.1 hypothetical protein [Caballeronia mineralivorans]
MADGIFTVSAAVIAASGALIVAYASSFLAEQYRRHLDSTSWAAALAGELESHASAFKLLKVGLHGMVLEARQNKPLPLYSMPMPTDPIFDSAPARVGALGPELAGELAYAYEQLRAFRVGLHVIAEHREKMDPDQIARRLQYLLQAIETNEQRLVALVQALYACSAIHFIDTPAMTWWRKLRRTVTGRR